jgi:predicted acylesterase/phospholipase RssA
MGLPLYDSDAMQRTLSTHFGEYATLPGEEPLLVVTAVDIERGLPVAFNSWEEAVTPEKIVASGSIPILYPPGKSTEDTTGTAIFGATPVYVTF